MPPKPFWENQLSIWNIGFLILLVNKEGNFLANLGHLGYLGDLKKRNPIMSVSATSEVQWQVLVLAS